MTSLVVPSGRENRWTYWPTPQWLGVPGGQSRRWGNDSSGHRGNSRSPQQACLVTVCGPGGAGNGRGRGSVSQEAIRGQRGDESGLSPGTSTDMVAQLEGQTTAEEKRTRITDPSHPPYSTNCQNGGRAASELAHFSGTHPSNAQCRLAGSWTRLPHSCSLENHPRSRPEPSLPRSVETSIISRLRMGAHSTDTSIGILRWTNCSVCRRRRR